MGRKRKYYSEADKLSLLREFYQSGMSKNKFCKEKCISSIHVLSVWMAKYSEEKKSLSLQPEQLDTEDMANRSKEDYKDENAQLRQRVRELEKALSISKLETEARDLMITRAEEFFDIPIRKKCGAK